MKKYYLRNRLCFPVKGINRGIIYDLNRQDYFLIPLNVYDKINKDDIITFENDPSLKEWEELLLQKEIIFSVENKTEAKLFPQISKTYEIPCVISNLIIHDNFNKEKTSLLETSYILNISIIIRDYTSIKRQELVQLINKFSASEVDSIYIYVNDEHKLFNRDDFKDLDGINQLFNIYIFNHFIQKDDTFDILNIIGNEYTFENFSKVMTKEKLQVNYPHFFEALNHHNYFNKKLYIDEVGNIKNGINNTKSFGNINKTNATELHDIIESNAFKKLWNVKKEDTLICKNCEFRYMCVDPRVPEQNKNGDWFHKLDCNYNPYLSKWSHEEDYMDLKACGVVINEAGELNIEDKKLKKVFNNVWSA